MLLFHRHANLLQISSRAYHDEQMAPHSLMTTLSAQTGQSFH